jgi:stage V sporulation protein R
MSAQIKSHQLPGPSDWTFELINDYHEVIRKTAEGFKLDTSTPTPASAT